MGFKENLMMFFSARAESTEKHFLDELKTRYYKTSKDKAIQAVEEILNQDGLKVKRIETDLGEVIATSTSGKKVLVIATVITVKPFRTAVDFSCSVETMLPSDFGFSRKKVIALYEKLDKELPYIGSGLGDELL
ncbi:DUF1499 domain-containing protein [Halalkalibacter urbisdiaboli]|uniref:DUF1499 domain-containing protein n=1 Tax=Halalkalibacter urbisdiaboli TaxID=1960589 RepID=UPI000B44EC13|nr:DUF1499 domain-containing protein [Halalkalibacter urbisdiaboli]